MSDLLTSYAISNGLAPLDQQGAINPQAMPVSYDFKNNAVIEKDYWRDQAAGIIGAVQTVYVDNALNPNPIVFVFQGTNFRLRVPALSSGFFPVVAPTHLRVVVSTPADPALEFLQVIYLNVPMPLTVWGPVTVNVGNVNASFSPVVTPTIPAAAQTIAAGGVPQALFGANANRLALFVQNDVNEPEPLQLIFASGAIIQLLPGAIYANTAGTVSGEAMQIDAATTGHKFNAWEQ